MQQILASDEADWPNNPASCSSSSPTTATTDINQDRQRLPAGGSSTLCINHSNVQLTRAFLDEVQKLLHGSPDAERAGATRHPGIPSLIENNSY